MAAYVTERCAWCNRSYGSVQANYTLKDESTDGICRDCCSHVLEDETTFTHSQKQEILASCREVLH